MYSFNLSKVTSKLVFRTLLRLAKENVTDEGSWRARDEGRGWGATLFRWTESKDTVVTLQSGGNKDKKGTDEEVNYTALTCFIHIDRSILICRTLS